ncbi:ATP-binding cassette domain-containing protein [Pseudactinotalea sp. HY160]|uniref:ATP-binding cassette domain-containing protein n=1 Tax=Pseudactinotalea sp. HY160 TaxID=2654490 RepID=UPI00128E52FD|nr:ATP-binding cassette domain-containing protein [Pseudactinotalea sp. HY160]MPV50295.1 ATP-binding cassette domain-containing protein [Pseudactinotalea sp. HY160]
MSNSTTVLGPLLQARKVSKRFGGLQALAEVDLEVRQGEHVALVGDNGAGKSTLVKILTGADTPDRGQVWFGGSIVHFHSPLDARRAGIETVYQTLALAEHLDVAANLFLGREEYRLRLGPFSVLNVKSMRSKARDILATTGVQIPDLHAPVLGMSGGQRQGVAIARAAGWGSRIIVLDEPTAALGVQETAKVEEIIRGLKRQGIAMLMISHNLRQVFDLVDTVWVLRHGRMVGHLETRDTKPEEVVAMITGVHEATGTDFA